MEAYIDESGDEGTDGRGTRWLTFGAVCVSDKDVQTLAALVEASCKTLGGGAHRDIHFNRLTHDDRKGVVNLLALEEAPWTGIVVASDTSRIQPGSALRYPRYQYNYALRYAMERISLRAAQLREPATIYIEDRRNFNIDEFRKYLALLRDRETARFDWRYLDPARIHVAHRRQRRGLCVADALAHAAFKALEPDRKWRHYETSYLRGFAPKLWRGPQGTSLFVHGLLTMPTSAWGIVIQEYDWMLGLGGE